MASMSGHTGGQAMPAAAPTSQPSSRRFMLAAGVVGFAFGGFFDGIMLHQVLQWHHLFSLVPGETWRDMRNQILMDGLFHVAHYLIALAGLWLLWRNWPAADGPGLGRRLLGAALLGFGAWQFVDIVGFHWIAGIHRIRVGVDNPLAYDLGWLALFGVTALTAGLFLWRGGQGGMGGRPAAAGLAALVLASGTAATLPPAGLAASDARLVLFAPGTGSPAAFAAVAAAGGRIVWADPSGELLAMADAPGGAAWRLLARGAVMVGAAPGPLGGCLTWAAPPSPNTSKQEGRA